MIRWLLHKYVVQLRRFWAVVIKGVLCETVTGLFNVKSYCTRQIIEESTQPYEFVSATSAMNKVSHGDQYQRWRNDGIDCGEDSYFAHSTHIGVADGVGGGGYCSYVMANELMKYARDESLEHKDEKPLSILINALSQCHPTNEELSSLVMRGATTCCIAQCGNNGVVRVANYGDSGAILVKERDVIATKEQETSFNTPYQIHMNTTSEDLRQKADEYTFHLSPSDVLILCTDGLLDNVFPYEIADIVRSELSMSETSARSRKATLQRISDRLLYTAFERSTDVNALTPFAAGCREVGKKYTGGKPDDITIVASQVVPKVLDIDVPYLVRRTPCE